MRVRVRGAEDVCELARVRLEEEQKRKSTRRRRGTASLNNEGRGGAERSSLNPPPKPRCPADTSASALSGDTVAKKAFATPRDGLQQPIADSRSECTLLQDVVQVLYSFRTIPRPSSSSSTNQSWGRPAQGHWTA